MFSTKKTASTCPSCSSGSVYPTNFHAKPLNYLLMPPNFQGISPDATDLGVYPTPKANTLIPLFLVLFSLIFKASKA